MTFLSLSRLKVQLQSQMTCFIWFLLHCNCVDYYNFLPLVNFKKVADLVTILFSEMREKFFSVALKKWKNFSPPPSFLRYSAFILEPSSVGGWVGRSASSLFLV